jgi:hypothetical protein
MEWGIHARAHLGGIVRVLFGGNLEDCRDGLRSPPPHGRQLAVVTWVGVSKEDTTGTL